MKRFATILLTTLALVGVLCVSASASSFDGAATELSAIGMFRGTSAGFELDKAPTRSQAAIMLVRLYGAEEEAQAAFEAGELECAFTDVSETSAPYVAWLADKGLTNGVTATTFGGGDPCSARAYTIFLLRALGYQDNVDFTTANAQEFAMGIGLLDTSMFSGTFLRDDVAAMTYQALGTDLKDGSTYLLNSLVESGAIDAAAAEPIVDKIEAYRALTASGQAMGQGVDADIDAGIGISVSIKAETEDGTMDMTQKIDAAAAGNVKAILDKAPQMAMDLTITMDDGEDSEAQEIECWLKDGVIYVRSGEDAYKMDSGIDMEALMALIEESGANSGAAMLPFIDSITAEESDDDTVYTMTLNDAITGLIGDVVDMILGEEDLGVDMDIKMSLDDATATYTVDKDGAMKDAAMKMTLKIDVDASDGEDAMTLGLALDLDMKMDIKATGKDVKITFPKLSDFEEIIGGADGPTAIIGALPA